MDKNFVKKNKLDEAVKRFQEIAGYKSPRQSLNEFTFVTEPMVYEEGDDDGANQQQQPPMDNGMQGDMQQPPMGDGMQQPQNAAPDGQNQSDNMNSQMGGEMPPQGEQMPQNGNMPPQGDMQQPPMDNGMQDQQMGMMPPPDEDIETEEMEPEDEVIDVDDLTQSQEATEYKIDGVDDRLSQIYSVVQKFSDKLDQQQQSIMNLKDEFEKRNPTQTEKFNIRSQASGPYNQTPGDYWDKFERENPNYEIIRDNDVSPSDEQDKFEIKKSDISGLNMKNISDTLNINQNLKDYLNF